MLDRLQKIISARGIASRRAAEKLILQGRVKVNGITANLGDKADPEQDEICVDGKRLEHEPEKVYIILNKPRGYVTTLSDERGRKKVIDLIADCEERVYPVGRLDINSEGLLLLTNDGDWANKVMHPTQETEKQYIVSVEGDIDAGLTILLSPIELDGKRISTPRVEVLEDRGGSGRLSIVIHEGRNRQVRRMCELAGLEVKRLVRVREGGLRLNGLKMIKSLKSKFNYNFARFSKKLARIVDFILFFSV